MAAVSSRTCTPSRARAAASEVAAATLLSGSSPSVTETTRPKYAHDCRSVNGAVVFASLET
jgi:hypothetical protein